MSLDLDSGHYGATHVCGGWVNGQGDFKPFPTEEKPQTFISIDLETTGLDSDKHGICQIGAWATGETEDHFKGYFLQDVNPHVRYYGNEEEQRVQVDREALRVNGFTNERIDEGVPWGRSMYLFNNWLKKWTVGTDLICVGQNTAFDIAWLQKLFNREGLDTGVFRRNVDCYTLSFLAFGRPMGLGKVASRMGIKYPAHDALTDAWAASTVFHRLTKHLKKDYPSASTSFENPNLPSAVYGGGATGTCIR